MEHNTVAATQVIALLGCTGSGKSLLGSVLRRLPGTVFANECVFPPCIAHVVNQPLAPEIRAALAAGFADNLRVFMTCGSTNSRAASLISAMAGQMGLRELVAILWRGQRNKRCLFESNFFTLAPDFVFEALPECRMICMVRDGRDCAHVLSRRYNPFTDERLTSLSHTEMLVGRQYDHRYVPWWVEVGSELAFLNATPFLRCLWMWKAMTRRFQHFYDRLDVPARARVAIIRYEDLVSNPSTTIDQMLQFVGQPDSALARRAAKKLHARNVCLSLARPPEELRRAASLVYDELMLHGYSVPSKGFHSIDSAGRRDEHIVATRAS
jgi:hypothetical protein